MSSLGLGIIFLLASCVVGWQCWRLQREQDQLAQNLLVASLRCVDATRVQDGMGKLVRSLHFHTARSVYGSIRALNRVLGLQLRQGPGNKPERQPDSKAGKSGNRNTQD